MKLSQYAKKLGVCYKTAWRYYKDGSIPGAYQLPSGTIIVPDKAIAFVNGYKMKKPVKKLK
jgi:predicted site-specific integrase-resolvase